MHEDDMSFMREVFMPDTQGNEKPRLPYNQYIFKWGYHPMSRGISKTDPTSALAQMHRKYGDSFQALYKVPCPDGTVVELSVISGMMFYCRKDAPYEVYDGETVDPIPYQTDEDLMLLIAKLLTEGKTK